MECFPYLSSVCVLHGTPLRPGSSDKFMGGPKFKSTKGGMSL